MSSLKIVGRCSAWPLPLSPNPKITTKTLSCRSETRYLIFPTGLVLILSKLLSDIREVIVTATNSMRSGKSPVTTPRRDDDQESTESDHRPDTEQKPEVEHRQEGYLRAPPDPENSPDVDDDSGEEVDEQKTDSPDVGVEKGNLTSPLVLSFLDPIGDAFKAPPQKIFKSPRSM